MDARFEHYAYPMHARGACSFGVTDDGAQSFVCRGERHVSAAGLVMIDRTGRVARTTRIPVSDAPMMHDFALTRKYVVIVDVPITFDLAAAEAGTPVPYIWNPKHPMRVGVMPRTGGATRWFDIDPVLYSNRLNAYDHGDTVVMELTTMPAPFYAAGRGNGGPSATGTPALDRWTIDLRAGRVRSTCEVSSRGRWRLADSSPMSPGRTVLGPCVPVGGLDDGGVHPDQGHVIGRTNPG